MIYMGLRCRGLHGWVIPETVDRNILKSYAWNFMNKMDLVTKYNFQFKFKFKF